MAATAQHNDRPAPEWDLQEVRRILQDKLRGYSVRLYLFGSRARGDAGRTSDIDVAILPKTSLPDGLLAEIREALEDSQVIYRVDLVDLSTAPEALRDKILSQGILWND